MWKYLILSTTLLTAAAAADRPELSGTWIFDSAHSQAADAKLKSQTWSITQKDDTIAIGEAITDTGGKEKKIDIECSTEGQKCQVKELGQPTQVTLYYNGPALVMLEQWHGTDFATKKRIVTSGDGKTLTVEVEHLAPAGRKNETWTFVKQ